MGFGIGGDLMRGGISCVPWPDGVWLVFNGALIDMLDVGDGYILFVE